MDMIGKTEKVEKKHPKKRIAKYVALSILFLAVIWLVMPSQRIIMPVEGASKSSYHPKSFWYYPWGKDHHHKGIDIFAPEGRNIHPACAGLVLYGGSTSGKGGNIVAIIGSGGRIYYYAHMSKVNTHMGAFVTKDDIIGLVGRTGDASRPGCPPHLHFSIMTFVPQFGELEESEASRMAKDHFLVHWFIDPAKELSR